MTIRERGGGGQYGVDLFDGLGGHYHVTSVGFIFRALDARFPAHGEARMFRIGLDLFKFILRRGERPEVWFQRFGSMFDGDKRVAGFGPNQAFHPWMLLSLEQFSPRKVVNLLKDFGHMLPRTRVEHVTLQRATFRERILEGSAFDFRGGTRSMFGSSGRYFVEGDVAPGPLYMCLGYPVGCASEQSLAAVAAEWRGPYGTIDVNDGHCLAEGGGGSGISIDDEQSD